MDDKELIEHIQKQQANKKSPEKIKKELLKSGWLEDKIDEAFTSLSISLPATTEDNTGKNKTEISRPFSKKFFIGLAFFAVFGLIVGLLAWKFVFKRDSRAEAQDKPSYVYDEINQIIGDKEIAERMSAGRASADPSRLEVKGVARGVIMSSFLPNEAVMEDVTGGKAAGLAKSAFEANQYKFYANFAGLTEPIDGDYYEGWLVRPEPFDFISIGRLEKIGGEYSNIYSSNSDWRDYNLYVLTLEKDDGNPAPSKHILEGVLKK